MALIPSLAWFPLREINGKRVERIDKGRAEVCSFHLSDWSGLWRPSCSKRLPFKILLRPPCTQRQLWDLSHHRATCAFLNHVQSQVHIRAHLRRRLTKWEVPELYFTSLQIVCCFCCHNLINALWVLMHKLMWMVWNAFASFQCIALN